MASSFAAICTKRNKKKSWNRNMFCSSAFALWPSTMYHLTFIHIFSTSACH